MITKASQQARLTYLTEPLEKRHVKPTEQPSCRADQLNKDPKTHKRLLADLNLLSRNF
jgi:hypothetical protein